MKKYQLFVVIALFTILAVFANDEQFYSALQNCSSYTDSGSSVVDGQNIKFKNQILGWSNGKCTYKEIVNYGGNDMCVTCKLSKAQVDELVGVMRAYSVVQKYSGEKVDTSKLSAVENNPVVNAWNKYLKDSSVCSIDIAE